MHKALPMVGKGVSKGVEKTGQVLGKSRPATTASEFTGNVLFDIPGKHTRKLIDDPNARKQALSLDKIQDEVVDAVNTLKGKLRVSSNKAWETLSDTPITDPALIKMKDGLSFGEGLEKSIVKDTLLRKSIVMQKADGTSFTSSIGKDSTALKKANEIGKFLKNKSDGLTQKDVKNLIQKIDTEINWDDPTMDVANDVLIDIRTKLDSLLKKTVPEYRAAMKEVAPQAKLMNNIIKEMRLKKGNKGVLEATDLTYTKLKGLQRSTGDSSKPLTKKALDQLGDSRKNPAGFMDDLELTQLYDQTKGGVTQGSRGVQMGAAGGAIAAGGFEPISMAVGALGGAAKDKYGRSAGGYLIPKMAPAIKAVDEAAQATGRGLERAGAAGAGEAGVDAAVRATSGYGVDKINEARKQTTQQVKSQAVNDYLKGNGGQKKKKS